jgi:mannose/cellobiose epimerase-like protein (N-acyl-D-glucosamine 2-epimerase family)
MKRRKFMGTAAGASVALGAVSGDVESYAAASGDAGRLAGKSLKELREEYRYWLFDDFLPFMDKYVIDHELGGFMCAVDRDGTQVNSGKRGWYEGRGIWAYSYLYNKMAKEQKYLDIAAKSVNFIMKYKPSGDNLWPENYKKDGTNDGKPDTRLYGDMFIALGLQEFSKAPGNEKYWDIAKEAILRDVRLYDRPDYEKDGKRVSGVWMCLINTISSALEFKKDAELEKILDRSIDAIFNYHYNPEFRLSNEVLNHDLSRNPETVGEAFLGHPIETYWMIMYDAVQRRNKKNFTIAADLFRRHVEVAWDDVYGGAFEGLDNVDENRFSLRKVLWEQGEVLIGALAVYEHTGALWAKEWFERMYTYVMDKFPLKKHGLPLWQEWGDRKVTFTPKTSRCEHFHHPRHLMFNMLALDRMIKRNGKPSGLFG